jgi:hypothetical protein
MTTVQSIMLVLAFIFVQLEIFIIYGTVGGVLKREEAVHKAAKLTLETAKKIQAICEKAKENKK